MAKCCGKSMIRWGILIAVLAVICLFPFQSRNVSVSLTGDAAFDAHPVPVTITCRDAYIEEYTFEVTASNGTVTFLIPYEYREFDSIAVGDRAYAQSVFRMSVLSNAIYQGDYETASCEGEILSADGTLNATATETIRDGRSNQWLSKAIIVGVILLVVLSVAVYRLMNKRWGFFKAVFVLVTAWLVLVLIVVGVACAPLATVLNIAGYAVNAMIPVTAIAIGLLVMIAMCVVCDGESKIGKCLIVSVYVLACAFALGKMVFYSEKVSRTPDEINHISYVATLELREEWFVPFEEKQLAARISGDNETLHAVFEEGTVNNLRHPPLYYWLVDAVDSVTFLEDGTFLVDLDRMRGVGMLLTLAALVLMSYIGYSRLKKTYPIVHLLFAAVMVSVPMLTYVAAGVNNDTLTLLTVTTVFLGLIRYCEKRRNIGTYLLIAVGVAATLLTKMTAGIMVALAALIVLLVTIRREHNAKELLSKPFLITLPLYAVAGAYYIYVFATYGAFQPSLSSLNEAYAHSTGFYPAPDERTVMGILPYISYFGSMFFFTWTGIASHILMLKPAECTVLEFVGTSLVLFLPLLMLSKRIRSGISHVRPIGAMCIGMAVTLVMQMINGYNIMMERGYGGGVQSRYYLCMMAVLALCAALLIQKALETTRRPSSPNMIAYHITVVTTAIFVAALVYDDLVYFLIHFTAYLR